MPQPDKDDLIRRLAMMVDCCMDHLNAKAASEKRAEAGKSLRQITHQQRAEAARGLLTEANEVLGREWF